MKNQRKMKLHEGKKKVQYNFFVPKQNHSQHLKTSVIGNTSVVHLQLTKRSADSDSPAWLDTSTPRTALPASRAVTGNTVWLLVRIQNYPINVVKVVILGDRC